MKTKIYRKKLIYSSKFATPEGLPRICEFDGSDIFGKEFKGVKMYAPKDFVKAKPQEREGMYNGIGPEWAGNTTRQLFTNAWGLPIDPAGYIHDWGYGKPNTKNLVYKKIIDKIFKRVFKNIVKAKSPWYLIMQRLLRAEWQFLAVKYGGKSSFLKGKSD